MHPTTLGAAAALAALPLTAHLTAPLRAQWSITQPANQPSGRSDALLAFDLPNNRMLMFGGNWSNEFWALDSGAWTQLQPAVLPPARRWGDIAVDAILGTVLLYGGDGGTRYALDDTWQWDGTAWTQLAPAQSPGGYGRHAMAFDRARQVTLLFGGRYDSWFNNVQSYETWEFGGGTWSLATPTTSPPARIDGAMSYHPGLGLVMLFGGEDAQGLGLDDTWTYDGADWTQVNTTGTRPAGRAGARLVQVFNRNLCVLFGGRDPGTLQIFNDTWEHDGTSWREVTTLGSMLPARHGMAMAHDIVRDRIVAFGGKTQNNALRNDTWEYGAHWRTFGNGCAGTAGVPAFTGGALPRLGQTCDATISNVPASSPLAFVAVGLSDQQWAFGALPALLTAFGMPACRAYTSADALTAVVASGGTAQWSWPVPGSPAFVGQQFYLQGIVLDPAANAGGATVTNAATLILGW